MKLYHIKYYAQNTLVLITGIVSAPVFFLFGKKVEFNFLPENYIERQKVVEQNKIDKKNEKISSNLIKRGLYIEAIPYLEKCTKYTKLELLTKFSINLAFCLTKVGKLKEGKDGFKNISETVTEEDIKKLGRIYKTRIDYLDVNYNLTIP